MSPQVITPEDELAGGVVSCKSRRSTVAPPVTDTVWGSASVAPVATTLTITFPVMSRLSLYVPGSIRNVLPMATVASILARAREHGAVSVQSLLADPAGAA